MSGTPKQERKLSLTSRARRNGQKKSKVRLMSVKKRKSHRKINIKLKRRKDVSLFILGGREAFEERRD